MIGKVKSFSPVHGYGFIEADGKEYYFHAKNCQGRPEIGDVVKFKGFETPKGYAAIRVTKGDYK